MAEQDEERRLNSDKLSQDPSSHLPLLSNIKSNDYIDS